MTTRDASEDDDTPSSRQHRKREGLKTVLMQLRAFLGDDAFPMTDEDVDALSFEAVVKHYAELGGRLDTLWDAHKERQRQREHDSFTEGVRRYRERVQKRQEAGQAMEDAPGEALIRKYAEPLKNAIIKYKLEAKSGKAVQHAQAIRFIDILDCFHQCIWTF